MWKRALPSPSIDRMVRLQVWFRPWLFFALAPFVDSYAPPPSPNGRNGRSGLHNNNPPPPSQEKNRAKDDDSRKGGLLLITPSPTAFAPLFPKSISNSLQVSTSLAALCGTGTHNKPDLQQTPLVPVFLESTPHVRVPAPHLIITGILHTVLLLLLSLSNITPLVRQVTPLVRLWRCACNGIDSPFLVPSSTPSVRHPHRTHLHQPLPVPLPLPHATTTRPPCATLPRLRASLGRQRSGALSVRLSLATPAFLQYPSSGRSCLFGPRYVPCLSSTCNAYAVPESLAGTCGTRSVARWMVRSPDEPGSQDATHLTPSS